MQNRGGISMFTVGEMMKNRSIFSPDLEAVVAGNKRYTYKELNHRVNQLAHYLLQCNVKPGDRIAVLCNTNHHYPTIFFAAAKVGAITVPLNWRLAGEDLRYIVNDCKPSILFYDQEFSELAYQLKDYSFIHYRNVVGNAHDTLPAFEEMLRHFPSDEPNVEVGIDEIAVIIYTSGTTGRPKGVMITHQNLFSQAVHSVPGFDLRYADRFLIASPLFHISGIGSVNCAIYAGYTLVLSSRFEPGYICDLINQEKVTLMAAVPVMLIYMLPTLIQDKILPTLRTIICGASKVPAELVKQYRDLGYSINQIYGATETTATLTIWKEHMGMESMDATGKALLGEVKIINPETNKELPIGEVGEILFKSPQVFKGYWNNFDETRKVLRNGWYHTGDAGKLDENGFLYVLDRYKDMVNCGGEKVFPAQVERVINEVKGVAESAVIGIKHSMFGEIPRAYVVKKPNSTVTAEAIITYCHTKLANFMVPEIHFIDELPKNAVGKVLKFVLREQAHK